MNSIDILGIVAGILTTSGFVPQIIKTYKTKKVRDISLLMFILLLMGLLLWLVYGIIEKNIPILFTNITAITYVVIILSMKIKYSICRDNIINEN